MKCFQIGLGDKGLTLHKGGIAICDGGALQVYGSDPDGNEHEFIIGGMAYGVIPMLPPERCETCTPEIRKPKLAVVRQMPVASTPSD